MKDIFTFSKIKKFELTFNHINNKNRKVLNQCLSFSCWPVRIGSWFESLMFRLKVLSMLQNKEFAFPFIMQSKKFIKKKSAANTKNKEWRCLISVSLVSVKKCLLKERKLSLCFKNVLYLKNIHFLLLLKSDKNHFFAMYQCYSGCNSLIYSALLIDCCGRSYLLTSPGFLTESPSILMFFC